MRMSHNEFIEFCRDNNVDVESITRKYVYVNYQAKNDHIIELGPYKINLNWKWKSTNPDNGYKELRQAIIEDRKIVTMAILKNELKLSLMEVKPLVRNNWEYLRNIVCK